ncbi:uncharacterized protein [Rutidosis leptorrhynchoides]|uniref:uncharacterized protein n=1 Tax=Rutidosis leptorrhynchoides TaxID=125765 RepID=UPI003A99A561
MRPLGKWNETLIVKQVWRIITQEESLWSKWVNLIKLKGTSFWDIQANDSWGWKYMLELRNKIKPHVGYDLVNGRRKVSWIDNSGKKVPFSTQQVWADFRCNRVQVVWHHVIWFKGFDPKHAFVLWLAVLNKLGTQDRLSKWYPYNVYRCVLCENSVDSVRHLFFQCSYSIKVWYGMKSKLIFKGIPDNLPEIVQRLSDYPFSCNIWNIINRMVLAASVYFLWHERNCRLFRSEKRSEEEVCRLIQDFIKCKILTLKVKKSKVVNRAASIWGIDWKD